jgi:hypothetical protein
MMVKEQKKNDKIPSKADIERMQKEYWAPFGLTENEKREQDKRLKKGPLLSADISDDIIKDTVDKHGKEFVEQTGKFCSVKGEYIELYDKIDEKVKSINTIIDELQGVFKLETVDKINAKREEYKQLSEEADKLIREDDIGEILDNGDLKALIRHCGKLVACIEKGKKILEIVESVYDLVIKAH